MIVENVTASPREMGLLLEELKEMLIVVATTSPSGGSEPRYRELRRSALNYPPFYNVLPEFLRGCRTLTEFWQFVRPKFATYAERREYLRTQFCASLDVVEQSHRFPLNILELTRGAPVSLETVHHGWERAVARCDTDPEGAITAARSLLESVAKCILAGAETPPPDSADITELYRAVSKHLQLAPSQHSEEAFKRILGGCVSAVEGIGALRNRLGDAHGKGPRHYKPGKRHARLAVNMACTMAVFLLETWEFRRSISDDRPPS